MGRQTPYQTVEKALLGAIIMDSEVFTPSPLENYNKPEDLMIETEKQLQYVRRISRSVETAIRYHQGRAIRLGVTGKLTKHEKSMASKVYALFTDFEWLIQNYQGSPTEIEKLSNSEIRMLRGLLQDPINDDLSDLLNFDNLE